MVLILDRASQRNNIHIVPLLRPRIERERNAVARLAPQRTWLARRASSRGAARICRACRHRTVGAGMNRTTEYFETGSKKGRGRAQKSLDLIEAMYAAAEAAQPITGRGIGYKLFTAGLIPSMARSEMQRVYRLLKEARERGHIPWEWVVDENRTVERVSSWADPDHYAR